MGIIMSGILSKVSGKVAGVVGGSWKDKAYLRAWVKPANPNTAAQQTQRTKFSDCVNFCKPLVGQVFNTYTDKFQKAMSGFNFFIKRNIDQFDGSVDYSALNITEGPLSPLGADAATYAANTITIEFLVNYGNNGEATDQVFGAVYDSSTGIWYFAAAEVDRSVAEIMVTAVTGLTAANLKSYVWPAKYIGTVLDIIGYSTYEQVV